MDKFKDRIEQLTPEQRELFAKRLAAQEKQLEKRKLLLTLCEGDAKGRLPVFCFHPPIGTTGYYINLVRHLNSAQPFHGIQSPGFSVTGAPYDRIEKMAGHYLDVIRCVQPDGPYVFMGHSSGAYIAYEIAIQLQCQGIETPLIVVIDEMAPGQDPEEEGSLMDVFRQDDLSESVEAMYLTAWAVGLAHEKKLDFTIEELFSAAKAERIEIVTAFLKKSGFIPENATSDIVGAIMKMYACHSRADEAYHAKHRSSRSPEIYAGKLVLFRCTETTTYAGFDISEPPDTSEFSMWDRFCSNDIDVIGITGSNHVTIMTDPCVKDMAVTLQPYLDRFGMVPSSSIN